MAVPEGLHRQVTVIQFTDDEIRRIGLNARAEANKVMKGLAEKGTTSAALRSAQIGMAKVNAEMWANIGDATKVGIGDAVWNATEFQALYDEELFTRAGVSQTYWRQSMIAQAKQGKENLISRKQNGITLSDKVYRNQALSKGYVDRAINNGLMLGKSPREISGDVIGFIDPNVKGGASYAAMRLGRSEVLNAYHTTAKNRYIQNPWVERVRWMLSGSHPRPDECNEYAESVHITKGKAGEFLPADVPAKPHPNCLCYVDPVPIDPKVFVKNWNDGKYNDYIMQSQGCGMSA